MPDRTKERSAARLFTRPLFVGALVAATIPAADAASDIFLKITSPDIMGESQDSKHKDEIDVNSFAAGFGTPVALVAGGPRNQPSCDSVVFTKNLDAASVPLANAVMKGTVLGKAVFTFRSTGAQPLEYYVVTLSNTFVSSLTQSSGGDRPSEAVELIPSMVQLKYTPQTAAGGGGTEVTTVIDCNPKGR